MKTKISSILQNNIAASAIISILFLSSCKKEELAITTSGNTISADVTRQTPESKNSVSGILNENSMANLQAAKHTTMIKIDHIAARTLAPDYSISIKFDGTIIFEGRRNVAFVGIKEWQLASDKFMNVKQLFEHSGFNSIEDHLSLIADVPMVSTTWCAAPELGSKTLIDYNDGYPEGLISLRQKAEGILDLWQYVNNLNPRKTKGTVFN